MAKTATKIDPKECLNFVTRVFGDELHQKRKGSLADAALGMIQSGSSLLHLMGSGLASAKGLVKKHATKQIDRLLSNPGIDIWDIARSWVPYVIGERKAITVILDWTSFADDDQWTLSLNLMTSHGRATPLMWKTILKTQLKHNRARFEDQLLSQLKEVLPIDVKVTLIADRGFADQKFFSFLENELHFNYVIRIKANTSIFNKEGVPKAAKEWLHPTGRAFILRDCQITKGKTSINSFIAVKRKGMKDAWYLASNLDLSANTLINLYSKRWTIEPYFRDVKDQRYGFGLSYTHISTPARRDRLLLIVAICYMLLTVLGAAGEAIGFDRYLKVNTVKTRTHSLIRQGLYYYEYFPNFKPEQKELLLNKFQELLSQQMIWKEILFVC